MRHHDSLGSVFACALVLGCASTITSTNLPCPPQSVELEVHTPDRLASRNECLTVSDQGVTAFAPPRTSGGRSGRICVSVPGCCSTRAKHLASVAMMADLNRSECANWVLLDWTSTQFGFLGYLFQKGDVSDAWLEGQVAKLLRSDERLLFVVHSLGGPAFDRVTRRLEAVFREQASRIEVIWVQPDNPVDAGLATLQRLSAWGVKTSLLGHKNDLPLIVSSVLNLNDRLGTLSFACSATPTGVSVIDLASITKSHSPHTLLPILRLRTEPSDRCERWQSAIGAWPAPL